MYGFYHEKTMGKRWDKKVLIESEWVKFMREVKIKLNFAESCLSTLIFVKNN